MLQQPDAPTSEAHVAEGVELLLTAEEAYPAFERAFLTARSEIWGSFRIFDLATRLRTEEGRAIGETWFDLLVHVLDKGVSVHMALSDFDPIMKSGLHRLSWKARRAFIAVREVARPDAELHVTNATHSARVGAIPRVLLWPWLIRELNRQASRLNGTPANDRALEMESSPGLVQWLTEKPGGMLSARRWPPPPLVPGTHHQKIAVFDREKLYIGGLDLNERRYDDKDHARRRDKTWHDVQLMCRGPVVAEAQHHIESFQQICADKAEPPRTTRLLRTLSRRRRIALPFLGPKPLVGELLETHLKMIGEANELIYLETQFLRDRRIADALARAARKRPDIGLIVVLPGAPEDVAFEGAMSSDARFGEYLQAKCVLKVQEAFDARVAFCSPVRPTRSTANGRDTLCGAPIIYVHTKVSVFDDDQAIVSSANLNARSLSWDTEAGIALRDASQVAQLRRRVFRHWLGENTEQAFYDRPTAAGRWRARALTNAGKEPENREGFLVPHDPEPARSFGRWLPGIPDAMV